MAQTRHHVGQALGAHTAGGQPGGGQRAAGQIGALGLERAPNAGSRGQGGGVGQGEGALLPFTNLPHRGIVKLRYS